MKIKHQVFLLALVSLLFAQCSKKEVTGCMDSNAYNYDNSADINCCCEYLIRFDPQGTGNLYDVTWINESGSLSSLANVNNTWTVEYVVTLGASLSFSVTNKNPDASTTAQATIYKGIEVFKQDVVTGSGATASVSGILN